MNFKARCSVLERDLITHELTSAASAGKLCATPLSRTYADQAMAASTAALRELAAHPSHSPDWAGG